MASIHFLSSPIVYATRRVYRSRCCFMLFFQIDYDDMHTSRLKTYSNVQLLYDTVFLFINRQLQSNNINIWSYYPFLHARTTRSGDGGAHVRSLTGQKKSIDLDGRACCSDRNDSTVHGAIIVRLIFARKRTRRDESK